LALNKYSKSIKNLKDLLTRLSTFFDGCFHHPPYGIDNLAEESVNIGKEPIGEQLVDGGAQLT